MTQNKLKYPVDLAIAEARPKQVLSLEARNIQDLIANDYGIWDGLLRQFRFKYIRSQLMNARSKVTIGQTQTVAKLRTSEAIVRPN